MVKRLGVVLCAWLFVSSVAVAAPNRTGEWDLGMRFSGMEPRGKNLSGAAYPGLLADYGYNEWLAFGVEAGWGGVDLELAVTNDAEVTEAGTMNLVPIIASAYARANDIHPYFEPYAVLGFGATIVSIHKESGFAAGVNAETAFTTKIGFGWDWHLERYREWILNFEAAFYVVDSEVESRASDGTIISAEELDFWLYGVSFKYHFD